MGRQHSHFKQNKNQAQISNNTQAAQAPQKENRQTHQAQQQQQGQVSYQQGQQGAQQGQRQARRQDRPLREFTPLPLPMSKLMGGLVQKGMLTLLEPTPTTNPLQGMIQTRYAIITRAVDTGPTTAGTWGMP